jgi:hypothetical protein
MYSEDNGSTFKGGTCLGVRRPANVEAQWGTFPRGPWWAGCNTLRKEQLMKAMLGQLYRG